MGKPWEAVQCCDALCCSSSLEIFAVLPGCCQECPILQSIAALCQSTKASPTWAATFRGPRRWGGAARTSRNTPNDATETTAKSKRNVHTTQTRASTAYHIGGVSLSIAQWAKSARTGPSKLCSGGSPSRGPFPSERDQILYCGIREICPATP